MKFSNSIDAASFSICLCILMTVASCAPTHVKQHKPFYDSPVIDKSNVTFNLRADRMSDVQIVGEWSGWKSQDLLKNSTGVWTLTVTAMPPGIWHYFFLVNGLEINDPMNPVMQASRKLDASIVQIPSDPPAPWDPQNIPHGVLHTHQYFSTALGCDRHLIVYTPPGYRAGGPPLPVLYLTQGMGGTEQSWSVDGKAGWIADALIAQSKAVPMIIVMPNAHALPYTDQKFDAYIPVNTDAFIQDLRQDVRPLIDSNYNVRADGDGRAFAGLSMGGAEAFTLGLNHPDEFTWIAAMSPSSVPTKKIQTALDSPETVNARLHLLWVPAGQLEGPEGVKKFTDKLTAAGLKPEFELVEGDHSWPNWRRDLVKLMPRLFR